MIQREHFIAKINQAFEMHPICAILGPRQCGKTTLATFYTRDRENVHFYDLENPQDLAMFDAPSLTLPHLKGLVVIDEIQRKPALFPYLRYLADHSDLRFLILGSASPELIRQGSETLAGRIAYIELPPFLLSEVHDQHRHWLRGGFPKSYLADTASQSEQWRINYIKNFLERDLSIMGISIIPLQMRRLWAMVSHYHGQIVNISDFSRSLDMTDKTIKRYLDILEGSFMLRQLTPWFENIAKRQVKRPKLYVRDSGILHSLLGLSDVDILSHAKCGASWEGYAMEAIINTHNDLSQFYFWGTEGGAELDLLVINGSRRIGYEFKFSENPKITKSMEIALDNLKLNELHVVVPGDRAYALNANVNVSPLKTLVG